MRKKIKRCLSRVCNWAKEKPSWGYTILFGIGVLVVDWVIRCSFKNGLSYRIETLTITLLLAAGIVAILVWRTNVKRVNEMKRQVDTMNRQVDTMIEGNVETQFNNAVAYLGDKENDAIVLGGVHALHQIAVKHKNYRETVHVLFCGYLQEKSTELYKKLEEQKKSNRCPAIIQTLTDYLFEKEGIYKNSNGQPFKSDLSFSTLKYVNFNNADLTNCWFENAILTNCMFMNTNLKNCRFYNNAILEYCEFYGKTTLTDCNFWNKASLANCKFWRNEPKFSNEKTVLTNCKFYENASLEKCDFINATLNKCSFDKDILDNPSDSFLDESTKNSIIAHAMLDTSTKESLSKAKLK